MFSFYYFCLFNVFLLSWLCFVEHNNKNTILLVIFTVQFINALVMKFLILQADLFLLLLFIVFMTHNIFLPLISVQLV